MERSVLSASLSLLLLTSALVLKAVEAATDPADVAALQPLAQVLRQAETLRFPGWSGSSHGLTSLDPCGQYGACCGNMPSASPAQPQFITSNHSCAWAAVTCRNWRIVALEPPCSNALLCQQPYNGLVLRSLGNLTALKSLSLRDHQMTGSLPPAPDWQSLSHLDLHGNGITGTLPPQWGTQLKQLVHLDLGGNSLGGELPGEWGQLSHLQYLDLSTNNLQGSIPSSWTGMISLEELMLEHNCGLCGDVPFSSTSNSQTPSDAPHPAPLLVTNYSTSLGDRCRVGNSACSGYAARTPIIIVSVVLVSVALFLLQRSLCWLRTHPGADTSAGPDSPVRRHLEESGGLVKVVHPRKQIPTYECCVKLSVNVASDHHAMDAASANYCSNAAESKGSAAAPTAVQCQQPGATDADAEPTTRASWQYSGTAAATEQPTSGDFSPAGHQTPIWSHSCGATRDLCNNLCPGHIGSDMLCDPPPAVIIMPDRQHVALAVPDVPVSPAPECVCGSSSSSSRSRASEDRPTGRPDVEAGGLATAGTGSGQLLGHAWRHFQSVHHQALGALQRLRRGIRQPYAPST